MQAIKRLAGVAPEVNLRNTLHVQAMRHASERSHPGFEIQGRIRHQKSKNRDISGPTKRTYALIKKFKTRVCSFSLNLCSFQVNSQKLGVQAPQNVEFE